MGGGRGVRVWVGVKRAWGGVRVARVGWGHGGGGNHGGYGNARVGLGEGVHAWVACPLIYIYLYI
jgi:hypothetical protein